MDGRNLWARMGQRFALGLAASAAGLLVFGAAAPWLLGWRYVIVAGGSMEPTISYGSVAVMREARASDVEPGDIVMFKNPLAPSRVTTHRLVERTPDGAFRTRGDANASDDQWVVPPESVRARFLFEVPWVGSFARWLRTPPGYASIILLPGLALVGWELASVAHVLRGQHTATASESARWFRVVRWNATRRQR